MAKHSVHSEGDQRQRSGTAFLCPDTGRRRDPIPGGDPTVREFLGSAGGCQALPFLFRRHRTTRGGDGPKGSSLNEGGPSIMWAKISRYLSGAFVGWCSLLSWVLPPAPTSRYSMYPTIPRVSSIKTLIRPCGAMESES